MQITNVNELVKLLRERAIVATNVTIVIESDGKARVEADATGPLAEAPKVLRELFEAVRQVNATGKGARRMRRAMLAAGELLGRLGEL